jgi:hypothetical protein
VPVHHSEEQIPLLFPYHGNDDTNINDPSEYENYYYYLPIIVVIGLFSTLLALVFWCHGEISGMEMKPVLKRACFDEIFV